MRRTKYKHLFFDLDHTLWDHDRNSQESLSELFGEFGFDTYGISAPEFIERYEKVNRKIWKKYRQYKISKDELRIRRFSETVQYFNIELEEDDFEKLSSSYIERMSKKKHLFPSTMEVLQYLHDNYKMHIITNGFFEIQRKKLMNSGILHFFDNVIISEEVGKHKPHPELFRHALNVSEAISVESIMIGDNMDADIIGARSAGIDQVFFNPGCKPHKQEVTYEIAHLEELREIF